MALRLQEKVFSCGHTNSTGWQFNGYKWYPYCRECHRNRWLAKRAEAQTFVKGINAKTVCVVCGKQPIEWHRTEHKMNGCRRIGNMVAQGVSVKEIAKELALCTPLCRRCHIKFDGRFKK